MSDAPNVATVKASAFAMPTDRPEADGTLAWDKTTLVLCEVEAGGETGIGFSYTDAAGAAIVSGMLSQAIDAMHLHAAAGVPRLRHLEWFHDHVRIERMLFDGAPRPVDGVIRPDLGRPGHGLAFKRADAEPYRVH